jgi:opacity protein-like surface antigen
MRLSWLGFVAFLFSLVHAPARAELYVAGEAGIGFPGDFSNVKGIGTISGAPFGNLSLTNVVTYGGKVGYYFERAKWFGVETELFVSNPHVKPNQVSSPGANAAAAALSNGGYLLALTPAFNVMVRRPGEFLQPYAGLGIAVVNTRLSTGAGSSGDTAPSVNVLIGLKAFLTHHLAAFVEFKYIHATLVFDDVGAPGAGVKGVYQLPAFVGGLAWHF